MRLTKIYTRKGDTGLTTLGDKRISKDDLLIEALGNIDELNSAIGLTISLGMSDRDISTSLTQIQNELFDMGGELYLPQYTKITAEHTKKIEEMLDGWNKTLPPLKEFVLPQGTPSASACHLARTICRRAERSLVRLHRKSPLANMELLRYLNRLSDLLFVLARILARQGQIEEKLWEHHSLSPE